MSVNAPDRTIRVLQFGFLFFGFLIVYLIFKLPSHASAAINPTAEMVIALFAMGVLILGWSARGLIRKLASLGLPLATPLSAWFIGNVFGLACVNACLLFGFVLHSMGARMRVVEFLIGSAILSFLFWMPGKAPAIEPESGMRR